MSSTAVRTDTGALIEAHDVCVELAGRVILDHVHARIEPGEIVTLVGLNGSGKTTLVRALLGLIALDCGSVTRRRGLKIGYSPQTVNIDASLPLTVRRFLTLGESIGDARLNALLNEVGLGDILAHQVADLSGGELHRVLLARAMAREPDLLVLDEPLAGVDVAGQSEIYRLIARVRDRYNCGVSRSAPGNGGHGYRCLHQPPRVLHGPPRIGRPASGVYLAVRPTGRGSASGVHTPTRSRT